MPERSKQLAHNFFFLTILKRINFPVGIYYITTFLGEQESPIDWIENAFKLILSKYEY